MTYTRVIPRDLFNEASLLKCYGELALALHDRPIDGVLLDQDGGPFEALQIDGDGSTTLWPSVKLMVRGQHVQLRRPLNSREPWPLLATINDETELEVFHRSGTLAAAFRAFLLDQPAPLEDAHEPPTFGPGRWA